DVHTDHTVDCRVLRHLAREPPAEVPRDSGDQHDPAHDQSPCGLLAELATLDARPLQQLAVLLLGHALAALLDDRTHGLPSRTVRARSSPGGRRGLPGHGSATEFRTRPRAQLRNCGVVTLVEAGSVSFGRNRAEMDGAPQSSRDGARASAGVEEALL